MRMSEGDLVRAMQQHGIGTAGTAATHIKTLVHNGYVEVDDSGFVSLTDFGEALIESLHKMGLNELFDLDQR